ncbi:MULTISPECIES: hypothetical protein [Lactiplantibacillus]|uniref:hypothetical protein n=1 Tax=Lactiplantibacillus TaxID=2767842 RepID=UPI001C1FFF99|nr:MULTISPECIES: hypothetical protein [Lactiplantibacillus]MBU7448808.1 hypothetical protein [Lactiplantibacillus sp. 7.2.4]MBU7481273.1 hypothetical protein [Lactiplantibacillus pentosus]
MKKWLSFGGFFLCLLMVPLHVQARAGGNYGGGGSDSTSTWNRSSSDEYYDDRREFDRPRIITGWRHNATGGGFGLLVAVIAIKRLLRRRRQNLLANQTDLPPTLAAAFETLFYEVEAAWTRNDLTSLHRLMGPGYYQYQRCIIIGFMIQRKFNELDSLHLISLRQLDNGPGRAINILVTAQARDYFRYANKSATFNQQAKDSAYIERFQEIWTVKWDAQHQLRCHQITAVQPDTDDNVR